MEALLILVIVAALLALGYAAFNFIGVKKLDEGTDRMKEISAAIRVGANAFITYEYKIIAVVVVIIAIAFAAIFTVQYGEFSWEPSVCFMIGVIMSASAGWVGMKIATYANVRVSNTASTAAFESFLDNPAFAATASINSVLFIYILRVKIRFSILSEKV